MDGGRSLSPFATEPFRFREELEPLARSFEASLGCASREATTVLGRLLALAMVTGRGCVHAIFQGMQVGVWCGGGLAKWDPWVGLAQDGEELRRLLLELSGMGEFCQEGELPLDGRILLDPPVMGVTSAAVSVLPGASGPSIQLRLWRSPPREATPGLQDLGPRVLHSLQRAVELGGSLVLVRGRSRAVREDLLGKVTTLASLAGGRVVSIVAQPGPEIDGVHQVVTSAERGFDCSRAIRFALWQAPDVLATAELPQGSWRDLRAAIARGVLVLAAHDRKLARELGEVTGLELMIRRGRVTLAET